MPAVTIRQLPDETHRALKVRAALHGRSTEAEIRSILQNAVQPRVGLGARLAQIGADFHGVDFAAVRRKAGVQPAEFE